MYLRYLAGTTTSLLIWSMYGVCIEYLPGKYCIRFNLPRLIVGSFLLRIVGFIDFLMEVIKHKKFCYLSRNDINFKIKFWDGFYK